MLAKSIFVGSLGLGNSYRHSFEELLNANETEAARPCKTEDGLLKKCQDDITYALGEGHTKYPELYVDFQQVVGQDIATATRDDMHEFFWKTRNCKPRDQWTPAVKAWVKASKGNCNWKKAECRIGKGTCDGKVPASTAAPDVPPAPAPPVGGLEKCLCVFDVDRTLTAEQGNAKCRQHGAVEQSGVQDNAYSRGTLQFSQFIMNYKKSFCNKCYNGMVSRGDASGPRSEEANRIKQRIPKAARLGYDDFKFGCKTAGPLILGCSPKAGAVGQIVGWYRGKGINIPDTEVYFFDDSLHEVEHFKHTPYNAKQISCGATAHGKGVCGASDAEMKNKLKGTHKCKQYGGTLDGTK